MTPADYDYLSAFLLESSGLALGPGKEYLLEARLIPLAQSSGMADVSELVANLRKKRDPKLASAVTEAMTTNETSFFRDKTPFDDLKQNILPALIEARKTSQRLRFWCAAASTGQEPYTILMTIREHFPQLANWRIEFIATDLCRAALDRAKEGVYTQFEVQRGLPIQYLMKYFEQTPKGWQVKKDLRDGVNYQQLNLLDDFSRLGQFDVIFCRNVLIYFQQETKKEILDRQARMLRSDGYLLLGSAETVLGISDSFRRAGAGRSSIYLPTTGVPAR
ncbi:MAG: protein-glutamate O-methyltransferase CheR [Planctomycetaceae bacterium]|nr:protein-glutamate O-methyltransferase CheR [Planctomycetaceae bacterium]